MFYILLSVAVLAGTATTLGWLVSQRDAPAPAPAADAYAESAASLATKTSVSPSPQAQTQTQFLTRGPQAQEPQGARSSSDMPAPLLKMAKHIQEQEVLIQKLEARLAAIADNAPAPSPYGRTAALPGYPGSAPGADITSPSHHGDAAPLYHAPSAMPSLPHGSFVVQAQASKITDAPTDAQGHENRIADRMQTFESAMTRGDWAAAERHLNDLSSLLPADSLTLLRNKAWLLMNKGKDAESMKLYTRILERLPKDLNAQLNLAILEQRLGNRSAAAERLRRILDENPGQPDALAALEYLQALP